MRSAVVHQRPLAWRRLPSISFIMAGTLTSEPAAPTACPRRNARPAPDSSAPQAVIEP